MILEYRIIKKTFKDGHIEYSAQVKNSILIIPYWRSLTRDGCRYDPDYYSRESKILSSREEALKAIDFNIERIKKSHLKSVDYEVVFREI